jgi:cobalt/nickel transport system permease protein
VSALSTIDTLAHTNRWADHHAVDKLLWAGGLVVAALVVPIIPGVPMIVTAVAVSTVLAGIPWRDLAVVVRVPAAFIVAGALATAVSVRFDSGISVGFADADQAAGLAARSIAGTSAVVLLAMTVPITELLARARQIRIPAVACEIALLMYRMIAVGLDRLRWQRLAQESRLGYVGFARSVRSSAALAVSAFVGSVRHVQRLSVGLGARNFDGNVPVLHDAARHSAVFIATAVTVIGVIVAVSFAWAGLR